MPMRFSQCAPIRDSICEVSRAKRATLGGSVDGADGAEGWARGAPAADSAAPAARERRIASSHISPGVCTEVLLAAGGAATRLLHCK